MGKKIKIAIPVIDPISPNYENAIKACGADVTYVDAQTDITNFDGLVLPGGADVEPKFYGEENVSCGPRNEALDLVQFEVLKKFVEAEKPVLGICRGHQVINVFFGGSMIQHLDTADTTHRRTKEQDRRHVIHVEEDCFLDEVYGREPRVNTAHHQGNNRPGAGLHYCGWAEDGVVEAQYHESKPIWSVQFHPERMCLDFAAADIEDGIKLFQWFIHKCRE